MIDPPIIDPDPPRVSKGKTQTEIRESEPPGRRPRVVLMHKIQRLEFRGFRVWALLIFSMSETY